MSPKIILLLLLTISIKLGTAVKCYNCYDLYNGTGISLENFGSKLVKCEKRQKDWNSWECPPDWPVCMIMAQTSKNHHEVVRTCAVEDFCSLYVPLEGVKLESCRECGTELCNDFPGFGASENSGPSFVFNVNLVVKKYTLQNTENEV